MPSVKQGESRRSYLKRAIPEIKADHPGLGIKGVVGMAEGMYDDKWHMTKKKPKKGKC
jgi:hypothetical protein